MVYYRKYRPQTLQEVIGQKNITEVLTKAFAAGQLAHAYLFTGPRGTGKTSTARILAKMVNCEKGSSVISNQSSDEQSPPSDKTNSDDRGLRTDDIPCNKCDSCISITDGSNLDYIEIDAASNRGIDDIRTLREGIKLAPSGPGKKVYVIDEVHMLTTEAFNALLKTLEEPPSHVLFILATTEAHKIPATILSRVQKLDFQLAKPEDLLIALENVVKQEKLEIEPEALSLIAQRAEGSFRDSLKLLDQLASGNEKITVEMVEESFKSGSFDDSLALLEAILQKDTKSSLELVSKQAQQGIQLKEFTNQVLEILRSMLLLKHGAKVPDVFKGEKLLQLKVLADKYESKQILAVIGALHEALEQMKSSSLPSLPLEVAVVESSQPSAVSHQPSEKQNTVILGSVATPESNVDSGQARMTIVEIASSPSSFAKASEDETAPRNDEPVISEKTKEMLVESQIEPDIPVVATQSDGEDLSKLLDKWNYILETVKPYNYSLEALLKQVKVTSCDDGLVILEVPYSFHQRILEAPKSRDLLESVISDVLGRPGRVSCILGQRPVRVEEISNIELAADDDVLRIAAEIFNS